MFSELDLTDQTNRLTIENFYKVNYEASEYLLPTDESLQRTDRQYFFYTQDNQIVGVTSIQSMTPTLIQIWGTVVHKDHRGKGIGNKINDELENYAKQNEITKISTNIFIDNLPSLVLKLKRGYIIEGLLRNHDKLGLHEYIMGLEIQ